MDAVRFVPASRKVVPVELSGTNWGANRRLSNEGSFIVVTSYKRDSIFLLVKVPKTLVARVWTFT